LNNDIKVGRAIGVALGVVSAAAALLFIESFLVWIILIKVVQVNVGFWQVVGCALIWNLLKSNLFPGKE
jgi:hypothetical protein